MRFLWNFVFKFLNNFRPLGRIQQKTLAFLKIPWFLRVPWLNIFVVRNQNPRFRPKNHSKIAPKSPDFARFQKPFVKSNPPFVK